MTKELTPMKRYAHQLQEFRHYLPSGFKEVQLNKKAEKYAYAAGESYHDKGVENDFVMIFKTPFNDISFAFAFSFQDLPLDKQHVFASIKKGKDNSSIQNSMPLTILEFKEKINTFNSWAKETIDQKPYRLEPIDILNHFGKIFLDQTMDMKKEIKAQEKAFNIFVAETSEKLGLPGLETKYAKNKETLEKVEKFIQKEIKTSPETKAIQDLKAQLKNMENQLSKKQKDLEKECNLEFLYDETLNTQTELQYARKELERSIEQDFKGAQIVLPTKLKMK